MKFKNITNSTVTVKDGKDMVTMQPNEVKELADDFCEDKRLESTKKITKSRVGSSSEDSENATENGKLTKGEMEDMTKDEINDWAARNGYEVKTSILKSSMINSLLKQMK